MVFFLFNFNLTLSADIFKISIYNLKNTLYLFLISYDKWTDRHRNDLIMFLCLFFKYGKNKKGKKCQNVMKSNL